MQEEALPRKIEVSAYSGYKANERPLSFVLDHETIEVRDVIDRWYGEDQDYFKVLADDGKVYLLGWQRYLDQWLLVKVYEKMGRH
ncbi:MAG: hypothetical protein JXL84_02480 [Deltaproteobacteria bacterium]|nr:hypothetical protein [Deltaproteobacteria bacterium]